MHFFRKFFFAFTILVTASILQGSQEQIARHNENLTHIVRVFDTALKPELTRIIASENAQDQEVDFAHLAQAIQQKTSTIKSTFAQVFKHQLTPEQQTLVVDLLQGLKDLSVTTTQDLILMAEGCCTYELRAADNKAMEQYCPTELKEALSSVKGNLEENIIRNRKETFKVFKKLEAVDLHNKAFNALNRFMCKFVYVTDVYILARLNDIDAQDSLLKGIINHIASILAFPFVVFNDFYFVPDWQNEFKKVGAAFGIMHELCSQLLETIEQK